MEKIYPISTRGWFSDNGRIGLGTTIPASLVEIASENIGPTNNDALGFVLINPSMARAGFQQSSPGLILGGQGWGTTAGVGSRDVRFRMDVLPVQGSTNPTGTWRLASSINGGAYASKLTVTSAGVVTITGAVSNQFRVEYDAGNYMILSVGATGNVDISGSGTIFSTNSNFVANNDLTVGAVVTMTSLAGSGSRAVLADATGILSAPVSDRSVKTSVLTLNNGLEKLMKLNPVTFEFKEGWKNYGEGVQVGFIAQDIQKVLPNSVFTTPSTGKLGINTIDILPVLTKGTQELVEIVSKQQQEINELKILVDQLIKNQK